MVNPPEKKRKAGLKKLFRTLESRNYRLFFAGQGISLVGTWMQRVAVSWLVYRMTGSELLLGTVSFLGLFPVFVLSPFAGLMADRVSRLPLLICTQVLAMLQAAALAVLVMTGTAEIWHIMLLAAILGVVNAFDTPIRQAFTVEMIEKKEDLGNAIALNSAMFNGARLVGPSVAGLLIGILGEGPCFLINAVSYLTVIAALMMMRITPVKKEQKKQSVLGGLAEGFTYAFGFAPIKAVLLLVMTASIAGMPYMVLMPVFARDILHGGPNTLGFLMGAAGAGALGGAIFLAARPNAAGLEKVIPVVAAVFGLGLVGFSLSHTFWLSLLLLVFTGFGMMVQMASSNTILQTVVDDDKRGRVMSFYVMCFMGMAPFGSLLAGWAAEYLGTPHTVLAGGLCCLAGAAVFTLKLKSLKPVLQAVYLERGLVAEVAYGMRAATDMPRPPAG